MLTWADIVATAPDGRVEMLNLPALQEALLAFHRAGCLTPSELVALLKPLNEAWFELQRTAPSES